jgi:hypothetical protein
LEGALEYMAKEKRSVSRAKKAAAAAKDDLGEDSAEYKEANAKYYKLKAAFDQIKTILNSRGQASQQAAAEVDKARFGGELDDYDKEEYRATIKGFNEWAATGDAAADRAAGQTLLAKLEDDAQFDVSTAKRRMDKRANDETKQAYYEALSRYEFISKELGDQSPAKLAEKRRT